ncbi:hypothetical protein J7I08_004169 [Vibrio vulnificus]|nr:hypothetical protein [Vibrio vulnificus]
MFKRLFDEAVQNELLRGDVIVKEVPEISNDYKEKFRIGKIDYDEIIKFSTSEEISNDNDLNMPGCTNFFMHNGRAKAAIFIKEKFDENLEESNELWKYLILVHEIGHVNDFRRSKYLNWKRGVCDLVMAEAFAEIYSLKFFSRRNDKYHQLCRDLLASRILDFENYGSELHRQILNQVLKTYSKKKLRQWSSRA